MPLFPREDCLPNVKGVLRTLETVEVNVDEGHECEDRCVCSKYTA